MILTPKKASYTKMLYQLLFTTRTTKTQTKPFSGDEGQCGEAIGWTMSSSHIYEDCINTEKRMQHSQFLKTI